MNWANPVPYHVYSCTRATNDCSHEERSTEAGDAIGSSDTACGARRVVPHRYRRLLVPEFPNAQLAQWCEQLSFQWWRNRYILIIILRSLHFSISWMFDFFSWRSDFSHSITWISCSSVCHPLLCCCGCTISVRWQILERIDLWQPMIQNVYE